MKEAGAAGARIVGGGFGGAVLGLFPPRSDPPEGVLVVEPGPPAQLL
jgi:galactokinase